MSWFTSSDTYRVTVTDPSGNEEGWVDLRPLNAGDKAEIDDSIALSDSEANVKLGTYRRLMVEKAVEAWSFELAPTPNTIAKLHPNVFDQIANEVSFGSPLEEKTESEEESS